MKVSKISVLLLTLLLGIVSVFHSTLPIVSSDMVDNTSVTLKHYHYDTIDYCMRASDVTFQLNEIISMDEDQLKQEIIRKSEPVMLFRKSDLDMTLWPNYSVTISDLDISQLKREPSQVGTPVTYTLPSVTEGILSQLQILVYIVGNTMPDSSTSSIDPSSTMNSSFSSSTELGSSTEVNRTTDSGSLTDPSGLTPDSGLVRPELSTSSPSSSDYRKSVADSSTPPGLFSGSSNLNVSQSYLEIKQDTVVESSKTAPDDKTSSDQSVPELVEGSLDKDKVAHSDYDDLEKSQIGNVATKIAIVSLGVGNGLMAVTVISDIRVVRWYYKMKRQY